MMRKTFLILLVLIFAALAAGAQSAKKCTASGRLIDDNGNPVSKALIYTDDYHQDDVDIIIVASGPNEEGVFSVESRCENGTGYLWISSAFDTNEAFVPVKPPYFQFAGKQRRYGTLAGIPFKGQNVKFGDIKIPIPYRKVWVKLQNESGAALFPTSSDWENVTFTVKNEFGLDVTSSAAPYAEQLKNENNVRDSSLLMSLPEGRWIIEIKPRRGKRLYSDKLIEVKNTGEPVQQIVLLMSRKKINQ
ncbi:MAG TPA: hypothetical protein VF721_05750 [Pyrinomonadaceae bacterium]|jgi:hypothetical protein